jgi:hypothetical protein
MAQKPRRSSTFSRRPEQIQQKSQRRNPDDTEATHTGLMHQRWQTKTSCSSWSHPSRVSKTNWEKQKDERTSKRFTQSRLAPTSPPPPQTTKWFRKQKSATKVPSHGSLSASKPSLLKTQQIESNRYPKKIGERRRKLDREWAHHRQRREREGEREHHDARKFCQIRTYAA